MAATGVRLPQLNVIVLTGRVVRDGELTFSPGGSAKLTMRVAVNRNVKDSKTGEWKEDTFFIDVIVWREQAERAKDKAKKGTPLLVEGRLAGREYEDKGQKKTFFEVVANRVQFLSLAGERASAAPGEPAPAGEAAAPAPSGDLEEVPF